jgi:hypothetical protein
VRAHVAPDTVVVDFKSSAADPQRDKPLNAGRKESHLALGKANLARASLARKSKKVADTDYHSCRGTLPTKMAMHAELRKRCF